MGAAIAAVAHPVLTGGELLDSDLLRYFLPTLGLMEGRIPVVEVPSVNPYVAGGNPYWADLQTLVLYPPAWLFSVAPAPRALLLYLALHAGVACWGAARMLRVLGLSLTACCAGGLTWGLTPWIIQHQVHPTFVAVAAWTPWIGERIRRIMSSERPWDHAPALCLLFAAVVAAASPDMILLVALPIAVLLVWDADQRGVAFVSRRVLCIFTCAGVALALTAPMWIPALRWVPQTIRPMMVTAGVRPYPLLPSAMLRMLAPGMLGNPLSEYSGPGPGGEEETFPGLLGLLALPLLTQLPRRVALWGGVLLAAGYLLGFTSSEVAGVNRVPSRFAVVSIFGATLLGAALVETAQRSASSALKQRLALWALVLVLSQVTLWRAVEHVTRGSELFAAHSVWATVVAVVLAAAGVWLATERRRAGSLLILVAIFTHGAHNAWLQQDVSPAGTYARPGAAAPAMREAGGRMLDAQPATALVNYGSAWRVPTVRGFSLVPRATWDIVAQLDGHPNPAADGASALVLAAKNPYSSAWEQLGVGSVLDMAGRPVPPDWKVAWRDDIFQVATPPWASWDARYSGGQVTAVERSEEGVRVSVAGPGGPVILAMWLEHGLELTVDGHAAPWERTPLGLLQVDVAPGEHQVLMTWSVPGLAAGTYAFAMGAAVWLLLVIARRRRGRGSTPL
ncbi:MAG: hypothetical protein AB2A00_17485 [Myxococcota bacterium]